MCAILKRSFSIRSSAQADRMTVFTRRYEHMRRQDGMARCKFPQVQIVHLFHVLAMRHRHRSASECATIPTTTSKTMNPTISSSAIVRYRPSAFTPTLWV